MGGRHRRVRAAIRTLRRVPLARAVIALADRMWWARTIRRADVVDLEYVAAQADLGSAREAISAYVRGGFRAGLSLNPLFCEQTVSRQLSDADRVPALYAYLVNDTRRLEVAPTWDAPAVARVHPDALADPGGPLGYLWRAGRRSGRVELGREGSRRILDWQAVLARACEGARAREERWAPAVTDAPQAAETFVVGIDGAEPDADGALRLAMDVATARAPHVQLLVSRPTAAIASHAALLSLILPDTSVRVSPSDAEAMIAEACAAAPSGTLIVRGPHTDIDRRGVDRLAEAASSGPAAPLWRAPDGTIASAGVVTSAGASLHLLSGHPVEDVRELGDHITVDSVAGLTFARPVPERGDSRTLLSLSMTGPHAAAAPSVGRPRTDVDALLRPAGLRLSRTRGSDASTARLERVAPPSATLRRRWAIKTAAPAGPRGEAWGDTHFARGLAAALERAGEQAIVDAYGARLRPTTDLDDVTLVLRGPERIDPPRNGGPALLWIISHPDEITADELMGFDRVFAASNVWAARASARFARPILPLLQCTDAHRFSPVGAPRRGAPLFVGTARGIERPSVIEPIRAGIPLEVYGPDWTGYIPAANIVATGVPNADLPLLYETAAVVLNDHWPAMRRNGFVSNRLFDVTAAGGRAISDAVEGIDELFQGAVRTYSSTDELIALLRGDLDTEFPAPQRLAAISAHVRGAHSFDARARFLIDHAAGVRRTGTDRVHG